MTLDCWRSDWHHILAVRCCSSARGQLGARLGAWQGGALGSSLLCCHLLPVSGCFLTVRLGFDMTCYHLTALVVSSDWRRHLPRCRRLKLFALFVIIGHLVDLFLVVALVLVGGSARADRGPHAWSACCQRGACGFHSDARVSLARQGRTPVLRPDFLNGASELWRFWRCHLRC